MSEEKTGHARLFDALTTKGTGSFTHPERRKLGLLGLFPTAEQTLAQQAEHVVGNDAVLYAPAGGPG